MIRKDQDDGSSGQFNACMSQFCHLTRYATDCQEQNALLILTMTKTASEAFSSTKTENILSSQVLITGYDERCFHDRRTLKLSAFETRQTTKNQKQLWVAIWGQVLLLSSLRLCCLS